MKKMKFVFYAALIFCGFAFSSCGGKSCQSKELGDIALSDRADDFIVYQDNDLIDFVNQAGTVMSMSTTFRDRGGQASAGYHAINVKKIGEYSDGLGNDGDCYEYYKKEVKSLQLMGDKLDFSLWVTVVSDAQESTERSEQVHIQAYADKGSELLAGGIYNYDKSEFRTEEYKTLGDSKKLDTFSMNGITFENVIAVETETHALYLIEGQGLVAFTSYSDDWVLKR